MMNLSSHHVDPLVALISVITKSTRDRAQMDSKQFPFLRGKNIEYINNLNVNRAYYKYIVSYFAP